MSQLLTREERHTLRGPAKRALKKQRRAERPEPQHPLWKVFLDGARRAIASLRADGLLAVDADDVIEWLAAQGDKAFDFTGIPVVGPTLEALDGPAYAFGLHLLYDAVDHAVDEALEA